MLINCTFWLAGIRENITSVNSSLHPWKLPQIWGRKNCKVSSRSISLSLSLACLAQDKILISLYRKTLSYGNWIFAEAFLTWFHLNKNSATFVQFFNVKSNRLGEEEAWSFEVVRRVIPTMVDGGSRKRFVEFNNLHSVFRYRPSRPYFCLLENYKLK